MGDTRPNHMLDYDELLFIKAEAAMNGWISGSAKEYYEAAITASCQKWGEYGIYASLPELNASNKIELKTVAITQKNIAALLASDQVKWNNTQQRLAEQKWLSLFWVIGFQMYHEMRRTGYPECKTRYGNDRAERHGRKVHRPLSLSVDRYRQQPCELYGRIRGTGRYHQRQHHGLPDMVERPGRRQ